MKQYQNRIALFTEPYTIKCVSTILTNPGPTDVLIENLYCGICGGDYSVYLGRRNKYPVSLGHEFVARIIAVGSEVLDLSNGQYVVSDLNYRCNKCKACLSGQSHLCLENNIELFSNRGFAKYTLIHSSYLHPITPPKYLPRACLIEPLSCVIHAAKLIGLTKNSRILLCGGGGIGMLFCFLYSRVFDNIEIYISETNPHKRIALNRQFGIKPYDADVPRDYDLIIDCSNSADGLRFSIDITPPGGKICVMSHLYGLDTTFFYEEACRKELRCYFPLRNGDRKNLQLAEEWLAHLWDSPDDSLLTVYDNIYDAFKEKRVNPICKQIVRSTKI